MKITPHPGQKGRLEGLHESVQAARLEIARDLLKSGMDIQSVMNVIGLTGKGLKQAHH